MACKLEPDLTDDLLYVKKGNVYRGYRREYLAQNLSKMEEGFVACKKCSGIMREASFSKGETTCSVCSKTQKKTNPVKAVQDSIKILEIKCPLLRDCDWKGELSEAETHLKDCLFFLIQCEECQQIFPRGDEKGHDSNSCPKRTIDCDYCGKGGKVEDKNKHLQYCDGYPICCPNDCGAEFPRDELSQHRSECKLEVITCPYGGYGCETKSMLRRDLLAHKKENIVEHTDMSLVQMSHFQTEIKQLKDENVRLKKEQNELKCKGISMKQLDGVEWEIKNIDKVKYGDEIEGPTFYVNNYKLRIYCVVSGISDIFWFSLKRIEGEFDRNLGLTYITHYSVINVNKRDYQENDYTEGIINYQLKIGTESEKIEWYSYFQTQDQDLLLRFYFDVNTKPLKSPDVGYSKKTPSPPITPKSPREYDPWDL